MVENRKLFYAISLMLLTCCQIISMLPHNFASNESTNSSKNSKNNNNTAMLQNGNYSDSSNSNKNNSSNNNNENDGDVLIKAVERKQDSTIVSSEDMWKEQENDSRSSDNIDDLIFLNKRPINQLYRYHHRHHHHAEELRQRLHSHHQYYHCNQHSQQNERNHSEFHHITIDGCNSNSDEDTDSLTDTTYSSIIVDDEEQENEYEHNHQHENGDDGVTHEIELQPDINEEVTPLSVTPLDLSDFLSLIPATKVKMIVNHYYHNDPEVQRAHAFMSSRDFLMLKEHIIAIPEMTAFLRYLNYSGLDLVKFATALTNLTSYDSDKIDEINKKLNLTAVSGEAASAVETARKQKPTIIAEINDMEYAQKQSDTTITPTISNIEIQITTKSSETLITTTAVNDRNETIVTKISKEQLNGLHGLVDSVLDVLPQDQILEKFFDKLGDNEQFSKLVDNISSPEFAKIMNNMQNSIPLRNVIFTLHNNGIYIIRIVESLKSYFFLGGF